MKKLVNRKPLKVILITSIVLITIHNTAYASPVDNGVDTANSIGKEIWKLVTVIGYWICAIYAVKDIIREIHAGDIKEITKVVTKYAFAFAALVFFIKILDFILAFA